MDNISIGLVTIVVFIVHTILCIPLAKRKIKMNRLYGIRMSKSLESEENWYKINEYGGKIFIPWSILSILAGIISVFLQQIIVLSFILIFILIPTAQLLRYSRKI
jgi:hypothetical protein